MFRVVRLIGAAILGTSLTAVSAFADDDTGANPLPGGATIKIYKGPTAQAGGSFDVDAEWANCNGIAKVVIVATDKDGTVIGSKSQTTTVVSGKSIGLSVSTSVAKGDDVTFQAFARDANDKDLATSTQKTEKAK